MPFPFLFLNPLEALRIYIFSQLKLKPCVFYDSESVKDMSFCELIKVAEKYTVVVVGEGDLMVVAGTFPNFYTRDVDEAVKVTCVAETYTRLHLPAKAEDF